MPLESEKPNPRPKIFSDQLCSELGEDLINQLTEQIYHGLTENVAQQPTSLCFELLLEDLDDCLLLKLVDCTLHRLNPLLITQEILQMLNHLPPNPHREPPALVSSDLPQGAEIKFVILSIVLQEIEKLTSLLCTSCNLRSSLYNELFLHPNELPPDHPKDLTILIQHTIFTEFRTLLTAEYDNFALKTYRKAGCIQSDMEFLAAQIKQLTINYPAAEQGLIEIADASAIVAQSFFSEEEDFAKIFKAVKAVDEMIEDLAHIYQEKLDQLAEILSLSSDGCPIPIEDHFTLTRIPTLFKGV